MDPRFRVVVATLAACAGTLAWQPACAASDAAPIHVEARAQDRPTTEGLARAGALRARHAHAVRLAPPAAEKLAQAGRPRKGAPLKVGVPRAVAELETETATAGALEWERLPGGAFVADLALTSPGASAVRMALRVGALPDAALLRFKGPADEKLFEVPGRTVNASLARDLAAGVPDPAARTYWSPVIEGDTAVVEIELPPGVDPRGVRIAMPEASHLATSAATAFSTPTAIGQSGACEVDASCSTGWDNARNAVAEMLFSDASGTYLCSGTLLADQDAGTNNPYFLSANHCISSQAMASSLVTYWFYRSSACGSGIPGPYQQLLGGATLLYHSLSTDPTYTDTSFMQLANTPPQGTYFAGWYAGATPSVGTAVTSLHQPGGDLLKISQGAVNGYLACTAPVNGGFNCNPTQAGSAGFYQIGWSSGVTEPGSSGGGLFRGDGTLVGQLYGGTGDCAAPADDVFGRFDLAYNAGVKSWLSAPLPLAVAKSGSGDGTIVSSPAAIACGSTCTAGFPPGTSVTLTQSPATGSTFAGWTGACSGTGACTVAMNSAQSVGAAFIGSASLAVSKSGSGTVTSSPAGIACGATCTATWPIGTLVTLSATPDPGLVFNGWSGSCSGSGACSLSMNLTRSVTASFGPPPSADVVLTQSASPASAVVGKDVVFTLTVSNNGPSTATNVTVTDTLPAGAAFIWASPSCKNASGTVTCNLSPVTANQHVQVVVRPAAAGSLTNQASVQAAQADPVPGNNAASAVVAVNAGPAPGIVVRYRLYSPVTSEHLFTTDLNEYNVLGAEIGTWNQEGASGHVLDNPGSFNGVSATPYYRLYNTSTSWHHWTTDANEYYTLAQYSNWSAEGVDGYLLPSGPPGATQLYRLLYPDGRGLHHWTIDAVEYNTLISTYGWVGEGGTGFVIQ